VSIENTHNGELKITVPLQLGFTMIWDSFECQLKAARILVGAGELRRSKIENTRSAARLMISLTGKTQALRVLRTIARDVAREVNR
jgi:hypothetical protein